MKDFLALTIAGIMILIVLALRILGICLASLLTYWIVGWFTDDQMWQWIFAAITFGGWFLVKDRAEITFEK